MYLETISNIRAKIKRMMEGRDSMKTVITIFGSTGDLMYKKLLPALSALIKQNHFPKDLTILAIGRRDYTTDDYINKAKSIASNTINWSLIESYIRYIKLDITNPNSYEKLKKIIVSNGDNIDVIYYLAVPPNLFPIIAKGISHAQLIEQGDANRRIVFEKPFGEDFKSAQKINQKLWEYFDESQIYRIDHFLGKEMIQNILVIRFANMIFESTWDTNSIESVQIIAKEKDDIGTRGNYYDSIGALKDMVQNHLIQMLALIAMEEPHTFDEKGIREEKVKLLQNLSIQPDNVIIGQYSGYRDHKNVDKNSNTETFVAFKAYIDNPRWKNTPFYFMTGKKLDEKRAEIIITFKPNTHVQELWPNDTLSQNKLIIRVSPDEGIFFEFNVKAAGLTNKVKEVQLDYCHTCQSPSGNVPEAYEKLFLDILKKNPTLFPRWDEIETAWQIIDPLKAKLGKPKTYSSYQDLIPDIKKLFKEDIHDL